MRRNQIIGLVCVVVLAVLAFAPLNGAIEWVRGLMAGDDASDVVYIVEGQALHPAVFNNEDPEVAKAAVYALANSLEDDEVGVLFEVVQQAEHPEVQKAALYALGNQGSDAAVETLIAVIESDVGTELKKAAIHALGNIGSPAARQALIDVLESRGG